MNKELLRALIEWRDARASIFSGQENTPEKWTRLANAESTLMKLAINLSHLDET